MCSMPKACEQEEVKYQNVLELGMKMQKSQWGTAYLEDEGYSKTLDDWKWISV